MLRQEIMIERVRQICADDPRLVSAMMYGSFTRGEGDIWSDIEFLLFFDDAAVQQIDQRRWVEQIGAVGLYFVNEFGNGTAIFEDLVRGEFHFDPVSSVAKVSSWRGSAAFPSLAATLIVDKNGELTRHLQTLIGPQPAHDDRDQLIFICNSLINWMLFGANVLARGEYARSLELLGIVQRYLLWLARIHERQTEHWQTPSKNLEAEISARAYDRLIECSAALDPCALRLAYRGAWKWGCELMEAVAGKYDLPLPSGLFEPISRRIEAAD